MEDEIQIQIQNASAAPKDFTFHLLERITNKFSRDNIIGYGGFGAVYKGVLDNGEVIAVKKLHRSYPELDEDKQFTNECINLMRVQHQNVIRLVGYCYEISHKVMPYNGEHVFARVEQRALCFEYMQGGSLDKHLSDESSGLGWHTRYQIIKGISEGLHYLHTGSKDPIYHLDLKPANILLDKNMMAKIGDFGLSRLVDSTQTCTTKQIRGTPGYMPPEYINRYQITPKFDVFSLGVIIIQIMAGREGYSRCGDMPSQEFIDLVHDNWLKTWQATRSSHRSHEVKTCIEIALRCVEADRVKRPTITEIVDKLNKIDIGNRSLIDQVTNSQSKQEINQYASSGADAESSLTALSNPRIKYGDEGTSMETKDKEHGTLKHKVWEEEPAERYKTQDLGRRSGGILSRLLSALAGLCLCTKQASEWDVDSPKAKHARPPRKSSSAAWVDPSEHSPKASPPHNEWYYEWVKPPKPCPEPSPPDSEWVDPPKPCTKPLPAHYEWVDPPKPCPEPSPPGSDEWYHRKASPADSEFPNSKAASEGRDGLLWWHNLVHCQAGELSLAAIQANNLLEDQCCIESASPLGTIIGVFDGHGSPAAACFARDHLIHNLQEAVTSPQGMTTDAIRKVFLTMEEGFIWLVSSLWETKPSLATVGTCCLVGVVHQGTLFVANLGDSRAVLGKVGRDGEIIAEQLSSEHNVRDEGVRKELMAQHPDDPRIVVFEHNTWRVKGIIQVSRSIGDAYLKHQQFNMEPLPAVFRIIEGFGRPILSANPSIVSRSLQPSDRFIIFASDGLWEYLSNEEAVEIVHKHERVGIARRLIEAALRGVAQRREMRYTDLAKIQRGVRRHFHDDITVVVLFIDHQLLVKDSAQGHPAISIRSAGQEYHKFDEPAKFSTL